MARALHSLLHIFFDRHDSWKFSLLKQWDEIFGSLKVKIKLEKLYEDTLILGVSDSCWMQELYLLSPLLLKLINQKLDVPRIRIIKFRLVGEKNRSRKIFKKKQANYLRPIGLTAKEQHALTAIQDPQLGDALKQFLFRCHRERG